MMNQKGQNVIDNLLMGIIAITVAALLLASFWPVTANFITLANTTPNFALWEPMANLVPVFLILMVIIVIIRSFTGRQQQSAPPPFS